MMLASAFSSPLRSRSALPMGQLPLMNEIAHYNEVDCKVMMEIVCYLRASH